MKTEPQLCQRRLAKLIRRAQRLERGTSRMSARQLERTRKKIAWLQMVLAAQQVKQSTLFGE